MTFAIVRLLVKSWQRRMSRDDCASRLKSTEEP
jgi:hypothetical protein